MKWFRWVKHAYQRIKKGYSFRDLWDIEYWFYTTLPNMLNDFSEIEYLGIPMSLILKVQEQNPGISNEEADKIALKKWRDTCKEIAHCLSEAYEPKEQKNEYEDAYFGWDKYDFDGKKKLTQKDVNEILSFKNEELRGKWLNRELEIENYKKEQLKKGMTLLTENLGDLWW